MTVYYNSIVTDMPVGRRTRNVHLKRGRGIVWKEARREMCLPLEQNALQWKLRANRNVFIWMQMRRCLSKNLLLETGKTIFFTRCSHEKLRTLFRRLDNREYGRRFNKFLHSVSELIGKELNREKNQLRNYRAKGARVKNNANLITLSEHTIIN